ncbi:iron-containing alcohol dehydrogenase family protein [Terrilactibacillus sp. S3-3]|nr:iron-containing alcohol dehydrogenase family protein [Terrilactibacillus sp. S3-3]
MIDSSPAIVKAGPQAFMTGEGILQSLPALLKERQLKNLMIVHGEKALKAAEPFMPSLDDFSVHFENYHGECTADEISRIAALAEKLSADVLIAIGGGKVMDIVKAAAFKINVPEILVPTVPSNCAAFASLSIVYNENGAEPELLPFTRTPHLVLIEPKILVRAPIKYLIAGIGDTLAKWYECKIGLEAVKNKSIALTFSYEAARICRDKLLENGGQALHDAKDGNISKAFLTVIDAVFFGAGIIGGLGNPYADAVGGHAFYNAATSIPETHSVLHGTQVAYGLLLQLALENKNDEIKQLFPFYRTIGLPVSARDVHLDNRNNLEAVAAKMAEPGSLIHALPRQISARDILQAVKDVEAITQNLLIHK